MTADGAATVETLRVKLARAKEQARNSDAVALKAVKELRAQQAAHCQSKEKIAKMAVELKDAVDRYQLLEKESRAKATDLEKAMVAAKEARSKSEQRRRSCIKLGISRLGSPFCCGLSLEVQSMPLLINYGVLQTHTWIWQQVLLMRPSTSRIKKIVKWKSCSGHSSMLQCVRYC